MVKRASDDLPGREKIALLRRGAKSLREGVGKLAASIKPEYHETLAEMWDQAADCIEAGEDPFEEEEESPEQPRLKPIRRAKYATC